MEGQKVKMTEEARDLLLSWNMSVNHDGTLIRGGEVVTPVKVNPNINLKELDEVSIDMSDNGALRISYVIHPISHMFECAIHKNEYADEVLYFYIP